MEDQKKQRKRKLIKKTKAPELVRSVKVGMATGILASAAATSTALMHFQDLWK